KASAGAMEYMPVLKVTNIAQTLDALKKEGLWIIGTEGEAKANLYSADFKGAIGLVIGSEGEGIRPLVAKKCDILVSIPIKGKVSSLNASAAAAVVMYEVVRQRGTAPSPSGRGKG
ncbi:MAG: TrmH family RNA methyltransferase, partial [Deltaproteobacteria bacterium]